MSKSTKTPETPVEALVYAGRLMFGSGWKARLAERAGVSRPLLSQIVSGRRALTPDVADRISDAIDSVVAERRAQVRTLQSLRWQICGHA